MKNLISALCAFAVIALTSCIGDKSAQNERRGQDTTQVTLTDSLSNSNDEQVVTGVAVDGAMNSIMVQVGTDTMYFSYPDLDRTNCEPWSINDTVTVKYRETSDGYEVFAVKQGSVS